MPHHMHRRRYVKPVTDTAGNARGVRGPLTIVQADSTGSATLQFATGDVFARTLDSGDAGVLNRAFAEAGSEPSHKSTS